MKSERKRLLLSALSVLRREADKIVVIFLDNLT